MKGTKTGFSCPVVPCRARWAHTACVCVFGGLISMLACWNAGVRSCHCCCPELQIKRNKISFCAHKTTLPYSHKHLQSSRHLLLFMSTLIQVSGKASWTVVCLSGQLLLGPLTHVQTCPLSPALFVCASSLKGVSFFHFYPPFHSASKATELISKVHVSELVQYN